MSEPLVSCLCVTENRPAFVDWVLWNFEKQHHPRRELVVIDSSDPEAGFPSASGARVVRCEPGTSVARKRNLALSEARGEIVTWFDDDDWQHPRKLSLLVEALHGGRLLAGSARSWFVDLATGRSKPHVWRGGILFNGAGFDGKLAARIPFDAKRARASDTPWMLAARRAAAGAETILDELLFFWLCHERNLSNRTGKRVLTERIDAVRSTIGDPAWGDTDSQLEALRRRVSAGPPRTRARRRQAKDRICVVVTTYGRPEGLERLLDDVERVRDDASIDVRVYDDASPTGYRGLEERVRARGWTYMRAARTHGKREWWLWWNEILADLRGTHADTYFVLQDDMRLCDQFFDRSLELWHSIPDPAKASLFLHLDHDSAAVARSRWTPVRIRRLGGVARCGWVDFNAFVCGRRLFNTLDWQIQPVSPRRWETDPLLSSGVGAQVSVRLHRRGLTMYRVEESLTVHADVPSLMNPKARQSAPLRTVRFIDGDTAAGERAAPGPFVFASLASVPSREPGLQRVVAALLPQVDRLSVYLNGYADVPSFLDDPRIRVALGREQGDRGDAGKFFWADSVHSYHLPCDDDLCYPADYVSSVVAGIERYAGRAVVGFHGAILPERPNEYYRSRRLFHFQRRLPRDTPVHVLGTGAAGYHVPALNVAPGDFPVPNMADVWLALLGQRQRIPFVCLAHAAGWLSDIAEYRADSIYARFTSGAEDRSEIDRVVRAHAPWRVHEVGPFRSRRRRAARRAAPARRARRAASVAVAVTGPTRQAVLNLPEGDHITLAVQNSGTYYESDLLAAIRERRPHGTFVDVGAHFGNHTVYFALECGADEIVAIEPSPTAFAGLLENVHANGIEGRVTTIRAAIHPSWKQVRLVAVPWTPRRGSAARTNSGMVRAERANGNGHANAVTLDRALASCRSIAVVKVDAEGLGPEILASGIGVLERDRPLVAVEAGTDDRLEQIRGLLEPLEYRAVGRFCWTPTWLWTAGESA